MVEYSWARPFRQSIEVQERPRGKGARSDVRSKGGGPNGVGRPTPRQKAKYWVPLQTLVVERRVFVKAPFKNRVRPSSNR